MKEGKVTKNAVPDMEAIGRYTRREYRPEEVYAFSLVLCDNQVDRDWERFSRQSLEKLAPLFLGKTILLDHQRSTQSQTARIYHTAVEEDPARPAQEGEPYARLAARAYLPRTPGNQELIERIESGMLKEVSVGCSMGRSVCSVCGKETCQHVKGRVYGGKRCHRVLEDPRDAFECSFVAVPAQRGAGVVKSYEGGKNVDVEKALEQAPEEGVLLTKEQAGQLLAQTRAWKEQARWGRFYREKLEGDALKYSAILQPELPRHVMEAAVKGLPVEELSQLAATYEKMAGRRLPLAPQLAPEKAPGARDGNGEFRI